MSVSADGQEIAVGGPYDNDLVGAAWCFRASGGSIYKEIGGKIVGSANIGMNFSGCYGSVQGSRMMCKPLQPAYF